MPRICLIFLLITGCSSKLVLPNDIHSVWIHIPERSVSKALNPTNKNWILEVLKNCTWSISTDVLASDYWFRLSRDNETTVYGQLLENDVFLSPEESEIYVCKISQADTEKIIALYK